MTAEQAALESLRESRERLALAARAGGLGIWDYDIGRDELYCDPAWYRIMGRDPGRPIRSLAEFRPLVHPEDVDRATEVERTAAELLADDRDYAILFRIVRPDGETRWLRSTACVLGAATGAASRAVGFVVDVTDAWRAEQALRAETERLAAALAQVKQLRGLLPICMYCKKVRSGRDYWEQVEAYVSRHTDARFSHGICPACWEAEVRPRLAAPGDRPDPP